MSEDCLLLVIDCSAVVGASYITGKQLWVADSTASSKCRTTQFANLEVLDFSLQCCSLLWISSPALTAIALSLSLQSHLYARGNHQSALGGLELALQVLGRFPEATQKASDLRHLGRRISLFAMRSSEASPASHPQLCIYFCSMPVKTEPISQT